MDGLDLPDRVMEKLLSISVGDWREELEGIEKFFAQLDDRLPKEMWDEYRALNHRLGNKT